MGMASFAVALIVTMVIMSHCIDGREFYNDQEIKVQQLLKKLNKPALKSIESEDGDTIDCVPLTSQLAFDHPLLKNHTIQMRPSFIPESDSTYTKEKVKAITQVWHKNGECPENTIPIRRVKKEDILRAKSVESFGKKTPPSIFEVTSSRHQEYAMATTTTTTSANFFGTQASINIWSPYVALNESSLAQARLITGVGLSLNTIEAGWQVSPSLYGGYSPRLFIHWTGYSGCFNHYCAGFVQISQKYSIGGALATISEYKGIQYDLNLLIWKDHDTGHWWLQLNDNDLIGYWPGSLFAYLGDGATDIQWGGEVYVHDGVSHSGTDMGSGEFPWEGYGKASYFSNLYTVSETKILKLPVGLSRYVTDDRCYSYIRGDKGTTFGKYFYYGGPGKNFYYGCP